MVGELLRRCFDVARRVFITGAFDRREVDWLDAPPLPARRARHHALRALRDFLVALRFSVPVKDGATELRLVPERVHLVHPGDSARMMPLSVAFTPSRGRYDYPRLGPVDPDPSTFGVAGPDTALAHPCDWLETIGVEAIGGRPEERGALVAGLESFLTTMDDAPSLRLVLPGYHWAVARFELQDETDFEDDEAALGRRRAIVYLAMDVPILRVVRASTMSPALELDLDGPSP